MNKPIASIAAATLLAFAAAGCHHEDQQTADVNSFETNKSEPASKPEPTPAPKPAPSPAHTPSRSAAAERDRTRETYRSTHRAEVARFEAPPACVECGTITHIETIETKGTGNTMGTIAGAVIGGVIGHQFGSGRGNTAATAAGAAGGAYAGNRAQANYNKKITYKVTVAMQDGTSRVVDLTELNGMAVGSKVKVVGSGLQPA